MEKRSKIITIEKFFSHNLNNYRDIYVYLPPGYDNDLNKRYPVLYMHDGQNLFDGSKSFSGLAWNMKITTDRLINEEKIKEIIIVGISNTKDRWSEYTHFKCNGRVFGRLGVMKENIDREVKGSLYENFIIKELKPYIDNNFITLTNKDNTALIGSSMGGLVTFNIGFRNPNVFGMLGIMSPAFHWQDRDNFDFIDKYLINIWIDVGEAEKYYVDNTRYVIQKMLDKGYVPGKDLMYYEVPNGVHSEKDWAERVEAPLIFFFGKVGKPKECKLIGRKHIGLKGAKTHINAVVKYDTGFTMSNMNCNYIVSNPEILEVNSDGVIYPKMVGKADIKCFFEDLKVSEQYEVIDELKEFVLITLNVKVPENTPEDDEVYLEIFKLNRIQKGLYRGTFSIPRDWKIPFKFTHGKLKASECLIDGGYMKDRVLKADNNKELNLTVDRWEDL